MKPPWKWYQERVAQLFQRIEDAEVDEDVMEVGADSGVARQLDIRVLLTLRIEVSEDFVIPIPVKIIVDCKRFDRRLDVKAIGVVHELKDDVRAQLAIAVSPLGVSKAAKVRAPSLGVYPVTVTDDLLLLLDKLPGEEFCLLCMDLRDEPRLVWWGKSYEATCGYCGGINIRCSDCLAVFGLPDADGTPTRCPECRAVYVVTYDGKEGVDRYQDYDDLEVRVLEAAYAKSNKSLTDLQVGRIIDSTRWQHWDIASPLI